ncbi:MAG: hypothetical protein HQK96_07025 [Nitrospirae bacterium]|nr:hypothetical protein [Nitrospirota bacterium]
MNNVCNQLQVDVSEVQNPDAVCRIRKIAIPACLTTRPLVVGDTEQCELLHALENAVDAIVAEYEFDEDGGPLIEYEVEINFSGSKRITVRARSEGEAEEMAKDDLDVDLTEYEIEYSRIVSKKRLE